MPSFGTTSPSLRKMELGGGQSRFGNNKPAFRAGNIVGDPFWLGTIGIGLSGWLIAFISSIIVDVKGGYPNYSWWSLVYTFFCIVGVIFVVGSDSVQTYHVAASSFLAAGLVFTTSSVNSLIYADDGGREAAAAGFILLSVVAIIWIFYFGSQPQASHRQTLDSFALHKDHTTTGRNSRAMRQSSYRRETTHSQPTQMYNSAQLAGFETSSPVTGYPGGAVGVNSARSTGAFQPTNTQPQMQSPQQQQALPHLQNAGGMGANNASAAAPTQDSNVTQPTEYPYRAKAIYSYEANPDDANEISFSKHEILEVSDVSGRWWQAKKENGETGIAPSNYLILL